MNTNPGNMSPGDFSELITELNHASTKAALEKLKAGNRVSKAGVFTGSAISFCKVLLSGLKYARWGRFYSAFYYSALRFLTGLKVLKLQNKL